MRLFLVSPPTDAIVTLAEAKAWLRVDRDDEDSLISRLIDSATDRVARITRRALSPQTLRLDLACWPTRTGIELPRPPLTTVANVKYVDTGNTLQTLDSGLYSTETGGDNPAIVRLVPGETWPDIVRGRGDAVQVTYVAGYSVGAVPAAIRDAILSIIEWEYDNRAGMMSSEFQTEILRRLAGHRVMSFAS